MDFHVDVELDVDSQAVLLLFFAGLEKVSDGSMAARLCARRTGAVSFPPVPGLRLPWTSLIAGSVLAMSFPTPGASLYTVRIVEWKAILKQEGRTHPAAFFAVSVAVEAMVPGEPGDVELMEARGEVVSVEVVGLDLGGVLRMCDMH